MSRVIDAGKSMELSDLTCQNTTLRSPILLPFMLALLSALPLPSVQAGIIQDESQDSGPALIFRQMGLEPTTFNSEPLGLSLNLPQNAHIQARNREGRIAYIVSDSPQPQFWSMNIESVTLTYENRVPGEWADAEAFLNQLLATKSNSEILKRSSPRFGGLDGQLCYIKRITPQDEEVINGWLVLPNGQSTLLVITMSILPEVYLDKSKLFERSFSTIKLRTEEQQKLEQRVRIENGRNFLNSITPERLKALEGQEQWFRSYRPASEDKSLPDREIACSVVMIRKALRGELNPNKPIENYTEIEKEEGLLVRVQGREIVNAERNLYRDAIAQFWMAWDQSNESWSVIGTLRQGQATRTEGETGIRTAPSVGSPIPRLTVIRNDPTPYEWDVPAVYLSQPLAWMLGQLLPRDSQEAQFFTYYFYNSRGTSPNIMLRYDRWVPLQDGSGQWQLVTLLDKNLPPDVSVYAPDGSLIRRLRPNGDITEPMSRERILRLWRNKGLRTGPNAR